MNSRSGCACSRARFDARTCFNEFFALFRILDLQCERLPDFNDSRVASRGVGHQRLGDRHFIAVVGQRLSLRSKLKRSDQMTEILIGETEEDINPYSGHVMLRRLDVRKPEKMWNEASFESTDQERIPAAYFLPATLTSAIERLKAHGIEVQKLSRTTEALPLEEFQIESNVSTAQAFENHKERTVTGRYTSIELSLPAGTYRVPMNQPLARLAFYLLEPRSDDGLLTWNFLDDAIKDSKPYPILRTRE